VRARGVKNNMEMLTLFRMACLLFLPCVLAELVLYLQVSVKRVELYWNDMVKVIHLVYISKRRLLSMLSPLSSSEVIYASSDPVFSDHGWLILKCHYKTGMRLCCQRFLRPANSTVLTFHVENRKQDNSQIVSLKQVNLF
jgi:hypothetical protein